MFLMLLDFHTLWKNVCIVLVQLWTPNTGAADSTVNPRDNHTGQQLSTLVNFELRVSELFYKAVLGFNTLIQWPFYRCFIQTIFLSVVTFHSLKWEEPTRDVLVTWICVNHFSMLHTAVDPSQSAAEDGFILQIAKAEEAEKPSVYCIMRPTCISLTILCHNFQMVGLSFSK